ncbi:MAG: hydantoinase/oxoprolinase family protein, partial [Candidatus Methanomethylophilus sp.]|nr:hydantoinase/oxoprolinase family protein [Methanomethylophilus sp.]
MTYGLGIDTGGTYTDTVIVDLETGKSICSNKALTTRDNLSVGIRESLEGLDRSLLAKISLTSLSSTLATNSVVEGKGCKVGLVCIGKKYLETSLPDVYAEIDGKFSMSGEEEVRLDTGSAKQVLEGMKGKVDAVVVSGYLSVRNPSHEERVAAMAARILDLPVVCGHELTSKLGFEVRTTTAVMNARLIPIIRELLDSVIAVMKDLGISSPLMVVKGDGAVMKAETAIMRPVETILSGPASSLVGAKALSGTNDAVVIDIGGTTTDIGILKNGFPRIEPEGARISGRRTRVMAADISTFGIGGDSRILVNGKEIMLTAVRVIPLCIAASKWPSVKSAIEGLASVTDDRPREDYDPEDVVQDTEFFILAHPRFTDELPEHDRMLLEALRKGPRRIADLCREFGLPAHAFSVAELERRGYVTRIGMTPTDLLHAEGSYTEYDTETSLVAAGYLS